MRANNKPSHTIRQCDIRVSAIGNLLRGLEDLDGISLNPSAISRIPGYLLGAPKDWHPGVVLNDVDGYFLKIKITSVGKKYPFPICRLKKDGANLWTSELVDKEITVDRFTLEDLIKYSKITYEIIQGYYFDEGRNDRTNTVIRTMFNDRLAYKKDVNPLQLIIKLMMNASYGICGLKPIDTDMNYISKAGSNNFIQNNLNRIKCFNYMPNEDTRFELYKEIDTHFNRQHVACEILSVSKNIMNEVMCLASDSGCTVH